MSAWLLIATATVVLYGLWLLLGFTFDMIDRAQSRPRNAGVQPVREKDERPVSAV